MNFAFLLLSPILLVRILDPQSFGQYREFVLYATLLASIATFSIPSSLLYFVPHDPDRARYYVSHANILLATAAGVAALFVWLLSDLLESKISFPFLPYLAVYVILYVNLDSLESYWLATQKPHYVLVYSITRTIVRLTATVAAAHTGSVYNMIEALIAVEALRIAVALLILRSLRLLQFHVNRSLLRSQLAFVVPIGLAGCLHQVNESIGQFAVSIHLGAVALATYTIASYQVPLLAIARGAISDAIFPDMVREAAATQKDRLLLWKRGNVAYSAVIIPAVLTLMWYADVLVPFVFSKTYVEAVPIFRILLLVMIVQCFEFSSPLRAASRTFPLLFSNVLLIAVNLFLVLAYFSISANDGLHGPALALVIAHLVQLWFLGWMVLRVYGIGLSVLVKWKSLALLWLCGIAAFPLLVASEWIPVPSMVQFLFGSLAYSGVYLLLVRKAGIEEVDSLIGYLFRVSRFRNAERRSHEPR